MVARIAFPILTLYVALAMIASMANAVPVPQANLPVVGNLAGSLPLVSSLPF
ncbi:hypothetical protein BGZ47_001335, partial [Haplosporangium gracile]